MIRIGDRKLLGTVEEEGTGDKALIDAEKQLMRIRRPRRIVVDDLGSVRLEPGIYDMTLKSAGPIQGNDRSKELFFPRAVVLVPER